MSNDLAETDEDEPITWRDFLETYPPMQRALVKPFEAFKSAVSGAPIVNAPVVLLYCQNEDCGREQYFDIIDPPYSHNSINGKFLNFRCRHCQQEVKKFSVVADPVKGQTNTARVIKIGEFPTFGSPTPSRLLRLFGDDSNIFLKGRQCENQGLGVGAFAYYRRVVENHKNQIIQEIAKVAKRQGADESTLAVFSAALNEISFEKALQSVKDAVPRELMVHGHNPLSLLHGALSQGLHDGTDEECLEAAHDIRVVLTELTERIGFLLKEQQELKEAVSRLLKVRQKTHSKQITEREN